MTDHTDNDDGRDTREIEQVRSRIQHHGETQRDEDHAGYLRVVKQFFQDIIRAFKIWHLVDNHPADARNRNWDWMIGMTYSSSAPSVTRIQFVAPVSLTTCSRDVAILRSPSIMWR